MNRQPRKTGTRRSTDATNPTPPTGIYRRSVARYGLVPVIAVIVVACLSAGTLVATITTGRPDGGLFSATGPLHGILGGGETTGTRDGDNPADAGDVTVDLNNDGKPDTRLDGNNDGDVNDPADPTIAEVTEQRDTITNTIAADPEKTHNSETLLTPPGADWWNLVTSVAAETKLYEQPAPDANWYAVTTNQATGEGNTDGRTYQAVHIGFNTPEEAQHYVGTATGPDQQWRFPLVRGSIVTFAPVDANPNAEPYVPDPPKTDATMHPKAAAWTVNIGRQNAQLAASGSTDAIKAAVTKFYANLGFTDHTYWNAVATNPDGPWTGKLTDYNPDAINTKAAVQAIVDTVIYDCDPSGNRCTLVTDGLIDLSSVQAWTAPGQDGIGENRALLPANAPQDAILTFGYETGRTNGIINGSQSAFVGPVNYLQGWITPDLTMVRTTTPGHTPDLGEGQKTEPSPIS